MNKDSTFDQIEAWLDGDLPDSEARAFEEALVNNTDLATEVEHHRLARQAIERLVEKHWQSNLALWHENMEDLPEPPSPKNREMPGLNPWILISALLLLVVAAWLFWPSGTEYAKDLENPMPQQEKPVPPREEVPVATAPTAPTELPPSPQTTPTKSQRKQRPAVNPELIAMADIQLNGFRAAMLMQYSETMGGGEDGDDSFTAGLKAYQSNPKKYKEAIQNLQKIKPADTDYYAPAQELLALIFFDLKNYSEASSCYEAYAITNKFPEVDWRLLHFYLADYEHKKVKFWKKIDIMLDSTALHPYKNDAIRLKEQLLSKGVSEEVPNR